MTNKEIISIEMGLLGITENINTFAGWKREGFDIKKGSKALFKTKIWKPTMLTDKTTGEKAKRLIMVNANFFGASQVQEGAK